jgi:hypothetical protein
MELMSDDAEEAIRLLTKVANGDVALVRRILIEQGGTNAKEIVARIRAAVRSRDPSPPSSSP